MAYIGRLAMCKLALFGGLCEKDSIYTLMGRSAVAR